MELQEFKNSFSQKANKLGINISNNEMEEYYKYMNLLINWNEKMNLTAITEPNDIIDKHFIDSITILKYIESNKNIIDVGTGAGFPGIPIKILRKNNNITLLDSLNKRLNFLNEVIDQLELKEISTFHSRIEDAGQDKNLRKKFDIVTSRAVASLNVLAEYMIPLVKINGICICMKGSNIEEEIKDAKNAIEVLGGKIEKIDTIILPGTDMSRNIIIIRKIKDTPSRFPRKAGIPSKNPIK